MSRIKEDVRFDAYYAISHAAHYIGMNVQTLRTWVKGRHYPPDAGSSFSEPLISLPCVEENDLSFINLVEAYVLSSMRFRHRIRMDVVRRSLNYVAEKLGHSHPLALQDFLSDGINLFFEVYGKLIDVSEGGQLAMRTLMEKSLRRIERDPHGLALRIYPFAMDSESESRFVVIDSYVSFGRPVIADSGVSTAIIAERWNAGENISELAHDYGLPAEKIEEAIWFEKAEREAA